MADVQVTAAEVAAVAEKLESFMASLPEDEARVLGIVLTRAAADPEVSGFSGQFSPSLLRTPFAAQLGRVVGFGNVAGGTITVKWGYKSGSGFGQFGEAF